MTIFVILIMLLAVSYIVFYRKPKTRNLFWILSYVMFVVISGFRGPTVGTDTQSYIDAYIETGSLTLSEVFQGSEVLYTFFSHVFSSLGLSYTVFFFVIALFEYYVILVFVRKLSKNPLISLIMFMSMGYFWFFLTGIRQSIAICFLLLSIIQLMDGHYFRGLLLVGVASLFHITSLVFLVSYVIWIVPLGIWYVIFLAAFCYLVYIYADTIVTLAVLYLWDENRRYNSDEYGGTSTLILLVLILICTMIFYWRAYGESIKLRIRQKSLFNISISRINRNEYDLFVDRFFIKLVCFSIPFQVLAIFQANAFRIAMMFHICAMCLVPNTVANLKDKNLRFMGYFMVGVALLAQFFVFTVYVNDIIPYKFFWE